MVDRCLLSSYVIRGFNITKSVLERQLTAPKHASLAFPEITCFLIFHKNNVSKDVVRELSCLKFPEI